MKIYIYLSIFLFLIIFYYFVYIEPFDNNSNNVVFRPLNSIASCQLNDIKLNNNYFNCFLNYKNSPINSNVNIIKYKNFYPNYTSPDFSDSDLNLLQNNNYSSVFKCIKYQQQRLFDDLKNPEISLGSIENNYYPFFNDNIKEFFNYLNDLELLQDFIDVNSLASIESIANLFTSFLSGNIITYDIPQQKYKLDREIVITSIDSTVINVEFIHKVTYLNEDKLVFDTIKKNAMKNYNYLQIFPLLSTTNKENLITKITDLIVEYGNKLITRNIITNYELNYLLEKLNDNKLLYVLNYYTNENDYGFILVKKIDQKLIFIKYFEVPFSYTQNLCPNDTLPYKGRCYDNCLDGYTAIGLSCIKNEEMDKNFNPDSNYCKQVCKESNRNIGLYDPIIQKACWCESLKCDKCRDFSVNECNC